MCIESSICRHCHVAPISRPRRLCWSCYYTPGITVLYPSTEKFGKRGVGNSNRCRLPDAPTRATPGTEAKVAVMVQRAAAGFNLFHPDDKPI